MTALELREKRAALHKEATDLIDKKTGIATENREKFDRLMAEVDTLKADIDRLEKADAVEKELRASTRPPNEPINRTGADVKFDKDRFQKLESEYRTAFWNAMRYAPGSLCFGSREALPPGFQNMATATLPGEIRQILDSSEHRLAASFGRYREYRDMGIGTPTASIPTSVLVPQGFVQDLEVALKWYGDMLNTSTILETASGQPLPYPTMNDTTVMGEIVGESQAVTGAAVTQSVDISVSNILLGAWKYSTKMVHVSLELLQDSAFNVEQFVKEAFAIRLGRKLNLDFTTGNGSSKPLGIITAANNNGGNAATVDASGNGGYAVIGNNNLTAPDPATQVGYLDLVNLEHSVDKAYRRGAKWMAHDTTIRYIKSLLDLFGRPLWLPGIAVAAPDTILGYPYAVNNNMDQLAQTSPVSARNTVAFGRLDKYLVRRVKDLAILRLVERFAEYGQVAFIGFARYDGNLLDAGTHPVKFLQNPS
jgi:HK97 family phage major capsid protein